MKQKSNQLAFFGTEKFSATVFERLLEARFQFEAVITKPDAKKGRGQKLTPPPIKTLALKHGIQVLQPENNQQLIEMTSKLQARAAVLVSYGKIIPQQVLDCFETGIINLHPSLLPKYRGPSPIESTILNGNNETGVSLIRLVKKMDAGPIYASKKLELNQSETASWLYQKLASLGSQLLIEKLPQILAGDLQPQAQDEDKASYCQLLLKESSVLRPDLFSATELERQIRAYQIFPRSRYVFNGHKCIILEAKISNEPGILAIKDKNNDYLNVVKLITPNGKTTSAESFVNGYLK